MSHLSAPRRTRVDAPARGRVRGCNEKGRSRALLRSPIGPVLQAAAVLVAMPFSESICCSSPDWNISR
ncbi:hypothetical protein, partial [Methylobacterium frigidaeris]|uniref:hypothetical protein n=1 Tax=Methylobacterium frigidaeris TaxID=2038277 RepID=UPI001A9C77D3